MVNSKSITMDIGKSASRLKTYRYEVELSYIASGVKEFTDITTSLTDFTVMNRYDKHVHPIIVADTALKRGDMTNIQGNVDNVKFKLSVYRIPVNTDNPENPLDDRFKEIFIKDEILIPFDVSLEAPAISAQGDDLGSGNSKDDLTQESINQYHMKFYFFSEKLLEVTRRVDSVVLSGASPLDAIFYLFNKHKMPNNYMIMNMPDNKLSYDQILIPPLKIKGALSYLQKYFGVYQEGLTFFLSLRNGYLLSNNVKDKNIKKLGEYSTVFMELLDPFSAPDGSQVPRYYDDKKSERYYIQMLDTTASISTKQDSDRELIGEDIRIISSQGMDGIWDITKVNPTFDDVNFRRNETKSQKVYFNTTSNPFNVTDYLFNTKKKAREVKIFLSEIDLDFITPNRLYFLKFTNIEKDNVSSGWYQLTALSLKFNVDTSSTSLFGGYLTLNRID